MTASPCLARIGRVASTIASSGAYLLLKYGLFAVFGTFFSSAIAATIASLNAIAALDLIGVFSMLVFVVD